MLIRRRADGPPLFISPDPERLPKFLAVQHFFGLQVGTKLAVGHGQGLAAEACKAVLDWADANLEPTAIWAIIAPANEPSIKLAERLGFQTIGESTYHDEPTLVLRRPAAA